MIADRRDRQFIGAFIRARTRLSSHRGRDLRRRGCLFLDPAARKVFRLIVIFVRLDEELSKRARQLVIFIAGKRAARSATS